MTPTEYRTYKQLKIASSLTESAVPKTVRQSDSFKGLLEALILEKKKVGRGYCFEVVKPEVFEDFFRTHFPEDIEVKNKSDNVRKYRNSKAQKTPAVPIFMLRGFADVTIDGRRLPLADYTHHFRLFACHAQGIKADRLCIVENLDTFLVAEKLLGRDFVFLHKYGRIGKDSLRILSADELLVFVDYDFNGLEEFLRIQEVFETARLYVPEDYDDLFRQYAQSLQGNQAQMTQRIQQSTEPQVIRIKESILRNNRFLEQQYWQYD